MLLRIDDTDPARNVPGGEEAILDDLRWLGIEWDEGPVRQSDRWRALPRSGRGASPARRGRDAAPRRRLATYHLASVVDDLDFGITHVIRGNDHRPNEALHKALARRSASRAPEYIHHGLVLGRGRQEDLQARVRAGRSRRCARRGSRRRLCARTSRSSGCRATTCISISSASARSSVDVLAGSARRGARGAGRCPGRGRARAARRARLERSARPRSERPEPSALCYLLLETARLSCASASCGSVVRVARPRTRRRS